MRLLVIVNVYRPDLGGGVLFADLCEGLAERGIDVTVRCAYPYYPEWADKSGRNGWQIRSAVERGVRVERFGLFIPTRPDSLMQRLLYEASFFLSLVRVPCDPGEFDAVMAFCPLVGGVAYGIVAARQSEAPLWLNVQDLSAEAAASSGIVKSKGAAGLLLRIQRYLFRRASVWSTIAPAMQQRLEAIPGRRPIHLIPNWLHRSLAAELDRTPEGSTRGLNPPRLLYSGNLGAKQDLVRLCEMLAQSDAEFSFRLQVGGSGAGALLDWNESRGDSRFTVAALSSEADLATALQEASYVMITEVSGTGASFIPSKLLAAMAAGTPVVAVCDAHSPLAHELAQSGAGVRFDWGAVPELIDWLKNKAHQDEVWSPLHEAALRRSDFYDRDYLIDQFAERLRSTARQ